MLKIRLTRMGAKKNPFYRIVVIDSRLSRSGVPTDTIGYYDPSKSDTVVKIDEEKALAWMGKGAQPTDTVRSILKKNGIMGKFAESRK
jgi:small subunit ribosomal protein S16